MAEHKCANCGFLTVPNRVNGEHPEVVFEWRQKGSTETPLCFLRAIPLDEIHRAKAPSDHSDSRRPKVFLEVINSNGGTCDKFFEHKTGYSPKEHQAMCLIEMQREEFARQRREDAERQAAFRKDDAERQERYEENRRKWEKECDNERRRWEAEQADKSKNTLLTIAFIGVFGTVAGSVISGCAGAVFTKLISHWFG